MCRRCFSRQDSLARHEKLHTRRRQPNEAQTIQDSGYRPVSPESIERFDQSHNLVDDVPAPGSDDSRLLGDSSVPPPAPLAVNHATEIDFDLIWPDNEELFQTIMSTDSVDQSQMPLGALPFSVSTSPSPSDMFGTPSSFDERPSSIGAIPSGGNSQAVQDVSKMISALVGKI